MIDKKQTQKNAILTVVNVLVTGVALFVLYKYLLIEIGSEKLGIWSIIMSISGVIRISDLGFSGSMVKFIAQHKARNEQQHMHAILETGVSTLGLLAIFISIALYFAALYFIPSVIPIELRDLAYSLLPYSLGSLIITVTAGIFLSSLDGLQRIDIKTMISMIGTIVNVLLIVIFTKLYGFIGLGYAQIGQSIFVLILGFVSVKKNMQYDKWLPIYWDKKIFQEILAYSMHLQVASIFTLLMEPLVKMLLGKFGSLSMVTYFDMSYRFIMQARAIIVNVNQVMVPVIADLHEKDKSKIINLYHKTFDLLLYVSIFIYSMIALTVPLVSYIWIGSYEYIFITFSYIILFATFINTMIGSAYFTNMGIGNVDKNTIAVVMLGLCNLLFGYLFGKNYGGYGVVTGYMVSIVIGSLYLIVEFNIRYKIAFKSIFSIEEVYYILKISIVLIISNILSMIFGYENTFIQELILVSGLVAIYMVSKNKEFMKSITNKIMEKIRA